MHGVNRTNYILRSFVCKSTVEELFNRWASKDPRKQGCKGAGWGKGLQCQLPQFHGKLGVPPAAWGKGEGTVQGTEPQAFPAGAGQPRADSLDMELLGSWVALLVVGDRQGEPPSWWQWWSPQAVVFDMLCTDSNRNR